MGEHPFEADPELDRMAQAFADRARVLGAKAVAVLVIDADSDFVRMAGCLCDDCFGGMVTALARERLDALDDQVEADDAAARDSAGAVH